MSTNPHRLGVASLRAPAVTASRTSPARAGAGVQGTDSGLPTLSECSGDLVTGEGTFRLRQARTGGGTSTRTSSFHGHFTATGAEDVGDTTSTSPSSSSNSDGTFREVLVSKGSAPNEYFLLTLGRDKDGGFYVTIYVTTERDYE